MKVSRNWLQKFFDTPLPDVQGIADALTFHVAEIEEIEKHGDDDVLDVKILPDRAAYLLSHRSVASELAAILEKPMQNDPLRNELPEYPDTNELQIEIENPEKCLRYIGALVRGVKVGPSPAWLKEALEAVGQRSINNIVDATNYVMLNIGQPLHAFDANKLVNKDGYTIKVRGAFEGEKITTLTGEEYLLPEDTLLITDSCADKAIGIAGIKGGQIAAVTNETTDIIIESANFDGTTVRRAAQALKLFTDASLRFQNRPSPELAAYGMRDVLALIQEIAGGEIMGVVDAYPGAAQAQPAPVSVPLSKINSVLGTTYTEEQVAGVFHRLGFSSTQEGETFTVTPPFERRDITIPEDLAEEVGRIIGYDSVPATQLSQRVETPDQSQYRGIERIKDVLIERGFTEISTQSFAEKGDVYLANPLDQSKPALRTNLAENMRAALSRAATVAPRVIGPTPALKLFEIGTVFTEQDEHLSLVVGYMPLVGKSQPVLAEVADALRDLIGDMQITQSDVLETELNAVRLGQLGQSEEGLYEPKRVSLGAFQPFSIYPFALRDIAVWTPEGTEQDEVENLIIKEAGDLLVRIDLFDTFEKEGRISYAFRLVFESKERTLSDEDLNPAMDSVTNALNSKEGWQVR